MELLPLRKKFLPEPPTSIRKLLGPSFILLGLGLGTGELILWPYLVANFGLGIIWAAMLGITMQFFLNMEIERYALANGESVFVGFARLYKFLPYWFIVSTAIAWVWPGFSSASATLLAPLVGVHNPIYIAIPMLLLTGIILTVGPVLYKTVESFQKILIMVGIPSIILITIKIAESNHLTTLIQGLGGVGEGFYFIPAAIPLMSFLAAFAYSGAGGNLNLAQSFYIKEKGYGMGKYAGRITSLITGKHENIRIEGNTFEATPGEIRKFRHWWKLVNIEHAIVFWGLGLLTILLLAVLSYASAYGHSTNAQGITFLFTEAALITQELGKFFGAFFIVILSLMLFATQLTVIDASGRIISENAAILQKRFDTNFSIQKIYYTSIWLIILCGVLLFISGLGEPKTLIVIGAVINAFCMFIFSLLLIPLNTRLLPTAIQPSARRIWIVRLTSLFLGIFTLLVLIDTIR